MGLKDLENGTVPTFLKVNRTRRGAPPRTADELLFQRHSVLLYMFIEQDKSITKLQARQDTVRLLQKQGFQLSPKPHVRDDNVLKSWIRNHRKTNELSQLRGLYVKLIGIEARPMDKARKLAKQLPEIISTGVYRKPQRK